MQLFWRRWNLIGYFFSTIFLSFQQANLLRAALTIKLEDKRWKRMRLKWRRIQQNFVMNGEIVMLLRSVKRHFALKWFRGIQLVGSATNRWEIIDASSALRCCKTSDLSPLTSRIKKFTKLCMKLELCSIHRQKIKVFEPAVIFSFPFLIFSSAYIWVPFRDFNKFNLMDRTSQNVNWVWN